MAKMPNSADMTKTPDLVNQDVVVPGTTALKPKKEPKKYLPEKRSLDKLNVQLADTGEVVTDMSENEKEGTFKMDPVAYLYGYLYKSAEEKATGKVIPGTPGVAVGSKAARKEPKKYRDLLLTNRGRKQSAPDVMHPPGKGGVVTERQQNLKKELLD